MKIAQINETYIGKLTFIVGFMKVVTRHTQELHENASQWQGRSDFTACKTELR